MELDALAARTREFIRAEVLEIDDRHDGDVEAAGGDGLRVRLQALAANSGLLDHCSSRSANEVEACPRRQNASRAARTTAGLATAVAQLRVFRRCSPSRRLIFVSYMTST